MTAVMASKQTVRLVVQVEEELRDALKLESYLRGEDMGVLVGELIRNGMAEALEQIRGRRSSPPEPPAKPRGKS